MSMAWTQAPSRSCARLTKPEKGNCHPVKCLNFPLFPLPLCRNLWILLLRCELLSCIPPAALLSVLTLALDENVPCTSTTASSTPFSSISPFLQVKHTNQEILSILFEGLRRLEYRGYDSAGVSVDWPVQGEDENAPSNKPVVIKSKGKVDDLVKLTTEEVKAFAIDPNGTQTAHAGIAHTRWATHGPPCARNSHPHVSSSNHEFVVVHNGTITNFRALKEFLEKEGEIFETDTDTEVIPKLCRFLYSRLPEPIPFPQLVCEVVKQLEGAYALLIKSSVYPGELVACRRGSPLILGMKYGIQTNPSPSYAAMPQSPTSPNTPLTPKLSGTTSSGPQFFEQGGAAANGSPHQYGLELFMASEASAVVEHTKQ